MLITNADILYGELMDVVRLFYGDDAPDISHFFVQEGGRFSNTVVAGGNEYNFTEEQEWRGEIEFKRYARRFAKLALYKALRAETGKKHALGRA